MIVHGIDLGFNWKEESTTKTYTCPVCGWEFTFDAMKGCPTFKETKEALIFHSDRCTRLTRDSTRDTSTSGNTARVGPRTVPVSWHGNAGRTSD